MTRRTRPTAPWRSFGLLLGLNLPSQPTFALILIGDEYLLGQLQLRNHRALCSRLGAHHMLSPWTFEEIQIYLKTGLEAVGINRSKVFEPAAVDLLVRATAGVPRSVCLLARAAWLEAARADAQEINAQTMQAGHGTGARFGGPDSPQLMMERIQQAHALYCRLTGQRVSLRFDRERLWYELFHAGFNEADLQKVIRYLQREIREGRRNVGALKLSNLLQIDRFEEDLNISRVQLYARQNPPPKSLIQSPLSLRKMRLLANGRSSSWPSGAPNTVSHYHGAFRNRLHTLARYRLPIPTRKIASHPPRDFLTRRLRIYLHASIRSSAPLLHDLLRSSFHGSFRSCTTGACSWLNKAEKSPRNGNGPKQACGPSACWRPSKEASKEANGSA